MPIFTEAGVRFGRRGEPRLLELDETASDQRAMRQIALRRGLLGRPSPARGEPPRLAQIRKGPALRSRAASRAAALPLADGGPRWSGRRTMVFVVTASAGLWGLIGLAVYGAVLLLRH
jgi:hypothetical protein